jgi:hypothetical protein
VTIHRPWDQRNPLPPKSATLSRLVLSQAIDARPPSKKPKNRGGYWDHPKAKGFSVPKHYFLLLCEIAK